MAKILVVDDDESILDAISLILQDSGHTVESATKGSQVYTKVHAFQPDLILLDVLLSGSDGRTICKKLKENPETKRIPIIMISAHPTAERSVKEYGADYFLAKPFGIDELLQAVSGHIRM